MERQNIFAGAGFVILAVISSCAKWLNKKDNEERTVRALFAEVATAVIIGLGIFCLTMWLHWNVYACAALSIVLGHMGTWGFEVLQNFVLDKFGIKPTEKDDEND